MPAIYELIDAFSSPTQTGPPKTGAIHCDHGQQKGRAEQLTNLPNYSKQARTQPMTSEQKWMQHRSVSHLQTLPHNNGNAIVPQSKPANPRRPSETPTAKCAQVSLANNWADCNQRAHTCLEAKIRPNHVPMGGEQGGQNVNTCQNHASCCMITHPWSMKQNQHLQRPILNMVDQNKGLATLRTGANCIANWKPTLHRASVLPSIWQQKQDIGCGLDIWGAWCTSEVPKFGNEQNLLQSCFQFMNATSNDNREMSSYNKNTNNNMTRENELDCNKHADNDVLAVTSETNSWRWVDAHRWWIT